MNNPAQSSPNEQEGFPIGRIIRTNLYIVAAVQGVLFLLLLVSTTPGDPYGGIPFMLASMVYVGIHGIVLAIQMLAKFVQGKIPLGMAYLAALGIVLTIGGGTCFLGGNR